MNKYIPIVLIATIIVFSLGACQTVESKEAIHARIAQEIHEADARRERDEKEMKARREAYLSAETQERESYILAHPELPEKFRAAIRRGQTVQGMSQEAVRLLWGDPERTSRSVGAWGTHEQWIYGGSTRYLYFENGILTSWQETDH